MKSVHILKIDRLFVEQTHGCHIRSCQGRHYMENSLGHFSTILEYCSRYLWPPNKYALDLLGPTNTGRNFSSSSNFYYKFLIGTLYKELDIHNNSDPPT